MIFRQLRYTNRKKRKKTLALFEQLLHLQALNLPLHVCLTRLLQIQKNPGLEHILIELEYGINLNHALEQASQHFDPLGLALLKLAAHSQLPTQGLKLYIEQVKLKEKLRHKLIEACFYPLLLVCLFIFILVIFQTQVLPAYQQLGQTLGWVKPQTQLHFYPSSIIFIFSALISLLSYKNIRVKLPWFGKVQDHFDWLTWLQIMCLAGDSGLNFSQALDFALPYIQNLAHYPWHMQLQQELAFGHAEYTFPRSIPAVTQNILALTQFSPDWRLIFGQAASVIQSEIEANLTRIERYLQPLLLLIVAASCGYLAKLLYTPLFQLGDAIL